MLDISPICIMANVYITSDMIEDVKTYGINTSMGVVYYPAIKLHTGIVVPGDTVALANTTEINDSIRISSFESRRTGDSILGYQYHTVTIVGEPTFLTFTNIPVVTEVANRLRFMTDGTYFYTYVQEKVNDQWVDAWNRAISMTSNQFPCIYYVYSDSGFCQMGVAISYISAYAGNDPNSGSQLTDIVEDRKPSPNTPGDNHALNNFVLSFGLTELFNTIVAKQLFDASVEVAPTPDLPSDDPYNKGGSTSGGGGTGTFSRTGDNIAIPALPTLSAVDAGFITIFNPSIAQLRSLAAYMWSDAFSIETFKKIFADPMDCILGMSIVPVNVPNGASKEVKVGNIGTGVSMTTAATQYVSVDCGTLNVEEYWGAYLDYDPYTKAEIYLPYIGTHPVAIDDVMGKSVHVVYHIDILSGACIAFIQCGGTVIYSFAGQCASSIPITGNDWTNVINGVLQIAGSIGTMVATGGISAPMNIANIASTAVNSAKPQVEKSGSLGGTGGMMGVQTPYLIITWPRQAVPYKQNVFKGYPSNITASLSSLSGFTVVDAIHLENIPATGDELEEIENLLKEGVIL